MKQDTDSPRRGMRAAVLSAAVIGAMFSGGFATAAVAHAQPPKSCMDTPDAEGCPHADSGPDSGAWVADQFYLVWGDPKGADYWLRKDGWTPDAQEAKDLAKNLGYGNCGVWSTKYVRCTGK